MPNQPRAGTLKLVTARGVEVELWEAAKIAAAREGTTRSRAMRQGLIDLVARHPDLANQVRATWPDPKPTEGA